MSDDPSTEHVPAIDALQEIRRRATLGVEERQQRLAELEAEGSRIKAECKQLAGIVSTAEAVTGSLETGLFAQASRRLDSAKHFADAVTRFDPSQSETLQRCVADLRTTASSSVRSLAESVPRMLPPELSLDAGSRFPRFSFRDGFLTVDVNSKKLEAIAQSRGVKPVRIDADASVIVEHVVHELNRCFHRNVDLHAFGRRLRGAYDRLRIATGQEAIELQTVLDAFDQPVPPRDEFAVDLAALIHAPVGTEPAEIRGMKLDHTRDTDKGFLLPGHETSGYIGSISFHNHDNEGAH